MSKNKRYRVGIDVGLNSIGLAAIEIDDSNDNPNNAMPIKFLSIMSVIHDGGIDPTAQRKRQSRKAISGIARRTRRLHKRQNDRYKKLDALLDTLGYPVARARELVSNMDKNGDPYFPWQARIGLVEHFIQDEAERKLALAVALRHIARHRGWRNPYTSIQSLIEAASTPSSFYLEFFNKIKQWFTVQKSLLHKKAQTNSDYDAIENFERLLCWNEKEAFNERPTVAQLLELLLRPNPENRFRKPPKDNTNDTVFVHIGKLHQSDNCYELLKIFSTQKIPKKDQDAFIEIIFHQINPKNVGTAAQLVGKDDLQPQRRRALRASLAFQKFRILTTLANLRIKQGNNQQRKLTNIERRALYEFLISDDASRLGPDLSWYDVADILGINRSDLCGVGGQTADGTPISSKIPPYVNTEHDILNAKGINKELKPLKKWWIHADDSSKEILIELLNNAGIDETNLDAEELQAKAEVEELYNDLSEMDEDALTSLDKISITSGRAAYSINTLTRLNARMLEEGLDLFEARQKEFGVDNAWRPSPNPLGTLTGNPAVDRTIKIVARWLKACKAKWGKPETIQIEHVRDGFKSDKQRHEAILAMDKRNRANIAIRAEIVAALSEKPGSQINGIEAIRHADIRRWQAIQRQNCQCLYCGKPIDMITSQMDHIVPRSGPGSSNELPNLVATCADCNASKNNTLFYTWASPQQRKETIERVKSWNRDSYFSSDKQFKKFKRDVISRLQQKEEDPPLDVRSMESVAWMARELREQIAGYFGYENVTEAATEGNDPFTMQRVRVFKGFITSEARRVSGVEKSLPWYGSYKEKTRFDRRHHAVDAAVIALMRPSVAKVLIERDAIRREQRDLSKTTREEYCNYEGSEKNTVSIYRFWKNQQMPRLIKMLIKVMNEHRIIVTEPLRLRLGMGRAHADIISPLYQKRVSDALSAPAIDKAETPALWTALTRQPDYDPEIGLPENPHRHLRVHGHELGPHDKIGFMAKDENELNTKKDAVRMAVRNGYVEIGDTIHHTKIYRIPKLNRKGNQNGWHYASLRVFQTDLVGHNKEDLFNIVLPPQSISVRSASPVLRSALQENTAEYLGWLVPGDEIEINPDSKLFSTKGPYKLNKFMRAFPDTKRFVVVGFGTNSKITLRPRELSSEGLPELLLNDEKTNWKDKQVQKLVEQHFGNHDWSIADVESIYKVIKIGVSLEINKVFSTLPIAIRRNTLGYPRWKSDNNMPLSWRVPSE